MLRAGGLSVRDLKRTAVALDVSEPVAAFWVELAYAAGLLASDGEADERYAATPAYDDWLELPAAERWARLATAWLTATRTAGLVGGRDAKGRTLSALGPGLDRSRRARGTAPGADAAGRAAGRGAPGAASVLARLRWERPAARTPAGRAHLRGRLATWALSRGGDAGCHRPGRAVRARAGAARGAGAEQPTSAAPTRAGGRATRSPSTMLPVARNRLSPPSRSPPPPRPPGSSPRCCPNPSTTSCSRPT